MNALALTLLGSFVVTSYQSITKQTDNTPLYTSINERVHPHGVAVSQDWLCPKAKAKTLRGFRLCKREKSCPAPQRLHYHDWIYIDHVGLKNVNDVMNERHRKRFDVWVNSYREEKVFDRRFGQMKLDVWIVNKKGEHCGKD